MSNKYKILKKNYSIKHEGTRERILVDGNWSFVIPAGVEYSFEKDFSTSQYDFSLSNETFVLKAIPDLYGDYLLKMGLRETAYVEDKFISVDDVRYDHREEDHTDGVVLRRVFIDSSDFVVDLVIEDNSWVLNVVSVYIRIRGEGMKPYDFQLGFSGGEETWERIKPFIIEIAESIQRETALKSVEIKEVVRDHEDNDFVYEGRLLKKYSGNNEVISLPKGVKELANNVFSGNQNLKRISNAAQLTIIGDYVFHHCQNLVSFRMGKKTISVGERAFEQCKNLKKIVITGDLKDVGSYMFMECENLSTVSISGQLETISFSMFSDCYSLKSIELPNSIKTIEGCAFKSCHSLKKIVLPEGVSSIGALAFAECENLQAIYLPPSVENIQMDWMNQHPFTGSKEVCILCQDATFAEKFAIENDLKYTLVASASEAESYSLSNTFRTKTGENDVEGLSEQNRQNETNHTLATGQKEHWTNQGEDEDLEIEVLMSITLSNEKELGKYRRKQDDFYDIYSEDFPTMNKQQIIALRKSLFEKRKDKEYISECETAFKAMPIEQRLYYSTVNLYNVNDSWDIFEKVEFARDKSRKYFTSDEYKLIDEKLEECMSSLRENIKEEFDRINADWNDFKYVKDKLSLKIKAGEYQFEKRSSNYGMFYDNVIGNDINVVIVLKTVGSITYSSNVLNPYAWYWGVNERDIWEIALRNFVSELDNHPNKEALAEIVAEMIDSFSFKRIREKKMTSSYANEKIIGYSDLERFIPKEDESSVITDEQLAEMQAAMDEITSSVNEIERMVEEKRQEVEAKQQNIGACYIATAVYGSYDAPEVMVLRRFRDEKLSRTMWGRLFIKLYYKMSPPVAKRLKHAGWINDLVKKILDTWVKGLAL